MIKLNDRGGSVLSVNKIQMARKGQRVFAEAVEEYMIFLYMDDRNDYIVIEYDGTEEGLRDRNGDLEHIQRRGVQLGV